MGTVSAVFRAQLRHRWTSWLAIAVLISVVGGVVLAAAAAGRRTQSAFPGFVAAHGFDAEIYGERPISGLARLPEVTEVTEYLGPDNGQPTCACTHPIDPTNFGVAVISGHGVVPFKLVSGRLPDPSRPD